MGSLTETAPREYGQARFDPFEIKAPLARTVENEATQPAKLNCTTP